MTFWNLNKKFKNNIAVLDPKQNVTMTYSDLFYESETLNKVYDSGIEYKSTETIHEALVQYRIGDMFSPKVNQTEALALGAKECIAAINENR